MTPKAKHEEENRYAQSEKSKHSERDAAAALSRGMGGDKLSTSSAGGAKG